jgi:hypothetical protein
MYLDIIFEVFKTGEYSEGRLWIVTPCSLVD